jgi:hypothetical protein
VARASTAVALAPTWRPAATVPRSQDHLAVIGQASGQDVLQFGELSAAGGTVKMHGHRLDAGASLEDGDAVDYARGVLLDKDSP